LFPVKTIGCITDVDLLYRTACIVTGIPGNVGSVGLSVVKLLRERDLPVRALVLRLDERSQALSEETGAELVVADLTNCADVAKAAHLTSIEASRDPGKGVISVG